MVDNAAKVCDGRRCGEEVSLRHKMRMAGNWGCVGHSLYRESEFEQSDEERQIDSTDNRQANGLEGAPSADSERRLELLRRCHATETIHRNTIHPLQLSLHYLPLARAAGHNATMRPFALRLCHCLPTGDYWRYRGNSLEPGRVGEDETAWNW